MWKTIKTYLAFLRDDVDLVLAANLISWSLVDIYIQLYKTHLSPSASESESNLCIMLYMQTVSMRDKSNNHDRCGVPFSSHSCRLLWSGDYKFRWWFLVPCWGSDSGLGTGLVNWLGRSTGGRHDVKWCRKETCNWEKHKTSEEHWVVWIRQDMMVHCLYTKTGYTDDLT